MEIDGSTFQDNREPPAVDMYGGSAMAVTPSELGFQLDPGGNGNTGNSNGNRNADESSVIIERILSAIEQRGENGLSRHGGPLTNVEMVKLSMLCTQQTERINGSKKKSSKPIENNSNDSILDEDLGFADVDADMMAQLVEHLEKHVALASQVDLIQSSYNTIQKLKKEGGSRQVGCGIIDDVSRKASSEEGYSKKCVQATLSTTHQFP